MDNRVGANPNVGSSGDYTLDAVQGQPDNLILRHKGQYVATMSRERLEGLEEPDCENDCIAVELLAGNEVPVSDEPEEADGQDADEEQDAPASEEQDAGDSEESGDSESDDESDDDSDSDDDSVDSEDEL